MKIKLEKRRIRQIILLIFAAHTILFIIELPQVYLYNAQSRSPISPWIQIARLGWGVYAWALVSPFVLWLGYLFPVTRKNLWRNLFLHLIFSVVSGIIQHFSYNSGVWMFGLSTPGNVRANFFNFALMLNFISSSMVRYATIIAIQQAYFYFQESQERAFRLQQAELEVLKMQMHPHFFFNTLNAISALIYRSPKEADRTITQLSDLFRISLKKDKAEEVSLKEELEFLQAYLQIHQTLMGSRLEVLWKIEPETLDSLVPNLILQPLVENAVQHGIAPLEKGGQIEISSRRSNDRLLLRVRDTGRGLATDKIKTGGVGLSNTQARLKNLYADAHRFEIAALPDGGGTSINLEIPFREQAKI
ncbi:MAG TPA: histidine kinase [Pyrinomonadaceae bacterium]